MKKKLIIIFSVIAVLGVAGYFGYRYSVNYVFDEYVAKTALTAIDNKIKQQDSGEGEKKGLPVEAILDGLRGINKEKYASEQTEEKKTLEKQNGRDAEKSGESKKAEQSEDTKKSGVDKKTDTNTKTTDTKTKNEQGSKKQTSGSSAEPVEKKQESQSSGKRLSDSEVLDRVISDSSLAYKMASMVSYADKQAVISMVMSNFTSDQIAEMAASGMSKSEMMSVARNSITGAQWSQCMAIARKYVDQMRPYVE